MDRNPVARRQGRVLRSSRATVGCEALETRQLLSGGMGALGMGMRHGGGSLRAELGSFVGGGAGAMFGSGELGVGGGMKNPVFLLTASLLNSGSSTTPISRSVLSSSAVQSAFQQLETDYNNDVSVGAKPTHESVGQLEDDLESIRKGTLTGSAATTAIQNDEAAILTSLGLTSTQVSQLQSDLSAVQTAIQSAASTSTSSTGSTSTTSSTSTTTSSSSTTTPPSSNTPPATSSAVQTAMQTLQTEIQNDTPSNAQPTHASIGQVQDDLDAIQNGTLTGSQALTQVQTDTAAVFTSEGLTSSQISTIQSDQTALASAIQSSISSSSSSTGSTTTTTSSTASPTSIAAVQATLQSVQAYLVGVPGVGGPMMIGSGGGGMGGFGGGGTGGSGGGTGGFGGGTGGFGGGTGGFGGGTGGFDSGTGGFDSGTGGLNGTSGGFNSAGGGFGGPGGW